MRHSIKCSVLQFESVNIKNQPLEETCAKQCLEINKLAGTTMPIS